MFTFTQKKIIAIITSIKFKIKINRALNCYFTDMAVITSDLPTLLGVSSGIAVLAGLICMVLHLFSKTKYPRHRNFADANIPPIMYSSDTGEL